MPNVIVLSAADAAAVTWTSADRMAALIPVTLTDGRSVVGPEVLTDVVHGRSKSRLQALPQVDYSTVTGLLSGRIARSKT